LLRFDHELPLRADDLANVDGVRRSLIRDAQLEVAAFGR